MSLLHPLQEYRFRKAFHLWRTGRTAQGVEGLRPLASRDPGAARFLPLALAEAREEVSPEEESREGPSPDLPPAFQGVIDLWRGDPDRARARLEERSRINPLEKALLGLASLEGKRAEEAARAWKDSGPAPWRVLSPRAMAAILEALWEREPRELQARLKADLRGEEEPPSKGKPAGRLLRRLLDPLEAALPALRGDRFALAKVRIRSLAARGDWDEAIRQARRVRREFKDREEATEILVRLLAETGRDEALLELGGQGPGRAALEGIALASLGRWEEALPRFRKALEEDPQDLLSAYGAACSLALQGRRGEAARAFLQVLALEETAFVEVLDRETRRFCALFAS